MKITDFGVAVVEGDSHLSAWVIEHGRLDVQDTFCRLFNRYIPQNAVAVDVGACLGDHTLSYSRMVGSNGVVHAFEPNPDALECLEYNMRSLSNVVIHGYGLGESKSTASRMSSPVSPANLGATMLVGGDEVGIEALDDVAAGWDRLDFLKIDAEGWEPRIIRGAMRVIGKHRPVLLIEVNRPVLALHGATSADIFVPLSSLGYSFLPCEPHLSMELPMVDVLCLPK